MITAIIDAGQHYCQAVSDLWQWDYGQTLRIQGVTLPAAVEVQFSTMERIGETMTRIGVTRDGATEVVIPDTLLEGNGASHDYVIYAFIYVEDAASGKTEHKIAMNVRARPKPEIHGTPEEDDITYKQVIAAVKDAADKAETAKGSAEAAQKTAEEAAKEANAAKKEAVDAKDEAVTAVKKIQGESEKIVNVESDVADLKSDVGSMKEELKETVKEDTVQDIVKKYADATLPEVPENIVLFEETEEGDTITPDSIIGAVLSKLDLRAVNGQTVGLYLSDTLIGSVKLEEFKTSEVICTGISLDRTAIEAYGKGKIELIAVVEPQDCTQKVRWISNNEELASVTEGTVTLTGRKGNVDITVVCGNYKTVCTITVMQYEYPDPNWEIGQILETAGSTFQKLGDSQSMRIATDYIETPVDTIITLLGGSGYRYQLYKYTDGKMVEMSQWITCSGTIEILSETYSGFALKVRKENYGKWTEEDIAAFAKTVQIESA